jgi:D-lactate dehydrogenase
MDDVAQLVAVEFGGSLKAEHGTGRNMAPFVELEWGSDAYQLMWQLKRLLDPNGILNPDVVLSEDPQIHLKHLKPLPAADEIVDKCIECGFCEPVCPSKGLTLSPRQRIVIWRDIQAKKRAGIDTTELEKAYEYQGIETCAATGLCAQRCPVGINTGELVKKLRGRHATHQKTADWIEGNFAKTLQGARFTLHVANGARMMLGRAASGEAVGNHYAPVQRPGAAMDQCDAATGESHSLQPERDRRTPARGLSGRVCVAGHGPGGG